MCWSFGGLGRQSVFYSCWKQAGGTRWVYRKNLLPSPLIRIDSLTLKCWVGWEDVHSTRTHCHRPPRVYIQASETYCWSLPTVWSFARSRANLHIIFDGGRSSFRIKCLSVSSQNNTSDVSWDIDTTRHIIDIPDPTKEQARYEWVQPRGLAYAALRSFFSILPKYWWNPVQFSNHIVREIRKLRALDIESELPSTACSFTKLRISRFISIRNTTRALGYWDIITSRRKICPLLIQLKQLKRAFFPATFTIYILTLVWYVHTLRQSQSCCGQYFLPSYLPRRSFIQPTAAAVVPC